MATIRFTVAARSAESWFSIFIASTTQSGSPAANLLTFLDRDRLDQARHRTEQSARLVVGLAFDHQRGELRLALGVDARFDPDAAVDERKAVEDRPHLGGDRQPVDLSAPDELTGRPRRDDGQSSPVGENDVDAAVARFKVEIDARLAEHHRALEIERNAVRVAQLPGNRALARVVDVVDMRRDGSEIEFGLAARDKRA